MFIKNLNLEVKFNVFLTIVFIIGSIVSGSLLFNILEQQAEAEVSGQAALLVQTMNSVRDYTSSNIGPLLNPRLETEQTFIPETVPAFSATEVFQKLRKNEKYRNFFYKEATLNPTNLRDKADRFESDLVEKFRKGAKPEEHGFRDLPGGKIFFTARPLKIQQASCLRCHSTPDRAPKSHINTYGSENGYGWKLGEIVAAQVISVPAAEVYDDVKDDLMLIMSVLIGIFAAILLTVNYLLRRNVIRPIRQMARMAESVSLGEIESEFTHKNKDEIGLLATAFNRMKTSLEISMKLLDRQDK